MAITDSNIILQQNMDTNTGSIVSDYIQVILKYYGDISYIEANSEGNISFVYLLAGYAIAYLKEEYINVLIEAKEIIYIELPKELFYSDDFAREEACITGFQRRFDNTLLGYGRGVICGIIDSGIDYRNSVFLDENSRTRILRIWDQSVSGAPPEGYQIGTLYTEEMINNALNVSRTEGYNIVNSIDISGHGTHVAGIMAGNFSSNKNNNIGIATQSPIIAVKLGTKQASYPQTAELMQAVDFIIKEAINLNMPVAINISLGNNYGSHDGTSLLETYINSVAEIWKCSICVGTGNEGDRAIHASGNLDQNNIRKNTLLSVGQYQREFGIQIWKYFQDELTINIITPSGDSFEIGNTGEIVQRFEYFNTRIYVVNREPVPYSVSQEILIQFIPQDSFVDSGIWQISIESIRIKEGRYDMWLPSSLFLSDDTAFLEPDPNITLTIPSTAYKVISVGGYNQKNMSVAEFSGRGFLRGLNIVKPDIIAPSVDILSASVGGGTEFRTGTSMATPFVSGSAALLMGWGIIQGNDPYMYGEKLKAYLIRGARPLAEINAPRNRQGWGRLCLENSVK